MPTNDRLSDIMHGHVVDFVSLGEGADGRPNASYESVLRILEETRRNVILLESYVYGRRR